MVASLACESRESLDLAAQECPSGSSYSIGKSGSFISPGDDVLGGDNRVEESRGTCYVNDEDEDEDIDFNPFVKSDDAEPSSSLSSEVEDLDSNDNNAVKCVETRGEIFEEKCALGAGECSSRTGNASCSEEIAVQSVVPSVDNNGRNLDETFIVTAEEGLSQISQSESVPILDQCIDTVHQLNCSCATVDGKVGVDVESEGAISMRTRARFSLARFTLDELETFLQETDDEEDLQKVDDEEEYRKFLASVLRGDELQNPPGNGNADEDEENDADFELELEEALESEPEDVELRRMTRLNKRQKTSREHSKKLSQHAGRQLRPLIPLSLGSYPSSDGNQLTPNIPQPFVPQINNSLCGFTPQQIGQLHCLIHEHVQLLIQVFSICVFEPVKSHIAAEVKGLISEMLIIRDQALAWKKFPYPSFFFVPPYVHPSVSDKGPIMLQPNCSYRNLIKDIPSVFSSMSNEKCACLPDEQAGCSRTPECAAWTPYICGPVLSVLDVAPLRLVENYVDDVASAVRSYERCQIELGFDTQNHSAPMFPFPSCSDYSECDSQGEIENNSPEYNELHSSVSGNDMPKKTMAAVLVEKAKSQPVSFVPKDIAKLVQRFGPLFNPALYPHKPPPANLANRVLFTDAEDELLALGLMEFNTDWKAIQQRFLPCKSTHQIFVRQKNRASSKAPENPIKVVRRMKNSPLNSEEIARIEVGLKKFKLDWISVWRFLVPYRDPSLLPRQWRIASGTQKSYKSDANKKAKRLLYELRRKASKTSPLSSHSGKQGNVTSNANEEPNRLGKHIDNEDEAYVHEAFLADWRPDNNIPSILHSGLHFEENYQPRTQIDNPGFGNNQTQSYPSTSSSQVYLRPYRARRPNSARVVKLAPDLPPVNLPSTVRIISQSAFKINQTSACARISGNITRTISSEKTTRCTNLSGAGAGAAHHRNDSDAAFKKCIPEMNGSDLQMHPLLFHSSQDAPLPYHAPHHGSGLPNSTFIASPGNQPQLALSLLHKPRHISPGKCTSSPSGVFHPLLQRNDCADTEAIKSIQRRGALFRKKPASSSGDLGMNVITPNSKKNQLDLDIHLSVTSKNQRLSIQGRNITTPGSIAGTSSVRESGQLESKATEDFIRKKSLDTIVTEVDTGNFEQVTESERPAAVYDSMHDGSFTDIIMEQEELSDSEEEYEENIDFEYEEMADSEGDDTSYSEQLGNTQNEEMLLDAIDENNDNEQANRNGKIKKQSGVNQIPESFILNRSLSVSPHFNPEITTADDASVKNNGTGKRECRSNSSSRFGVRSLNKIVASGIQKPEKL